MAHLYLERPASISEVGRFFQRRAARVLPLFFLVAGISYTAYPHLFPIATAGELMDHLLVIKGASILWTIPVEIHFYLLFPLIWLLYAKTGSAKSILVCAILAVVLMAVKPMNSHFLSAKDLQTSGEFFLGGLLVAMVLPYVSVPQRVADIGFIISLIALVLIFPLVRVALFGGSRPSVFRDPEYVIVCVALLATAAMSPLARALFGSAPMSFLGKISYSVYLLHLPVLWAIQHVSLVTAYWPIHFLVAGLCTLAVAAGSHRWVESPARDWINAIGAKDRPSFALARGGEMHRSPGSGTAAFDPASPSIAVERKTPPQTNLGRSTGFP